jgi:hypothetical protein
VVLLLGNHFKGSKAHTEFSCILKIEIINKFNKFKLEIRKSPLACGTHAFLGAGSQTHSVAIADIWCIELIYLTCLIEIIPIIRGF